MTPDFIIGHADDFGVARRLYVYSKARSSKKKLPFPAPALNICSSPTCDGSKPFWLRQVRQRNADLMPLAIGQLGQYASTDTFSV